MNITFVNMRREMYPLLGPAYLASYIKQYNYDVCITILDLAEGQMGRAAAKRILKTSPDVVAFTVFTVGVFDIIGVCKELKRLSPDISIWWGGPHITSVPHTLPPEVDVGVIGEGEETFCQLCQEWIKHRPFSVDNLSAVEGVCFHTEQGMRIILPRKQIVPLDAIPAPEISLLDMQWYTKPKKFFVMNRVLRGFVMMTSRGCPYRCTFCQAAVHWNSCRYHSAERVITELKRLREMFPKLNAVNIIDDLFIGNHQRLRDIVSLIRKQNLHDGMVFNVNGRANLIDREILDLLKSINVIQISYGFESGSERILKFLKKGSVSVAQNYSAAELTNEYGIGVGGQFMVGSLDETENEMQETIDFIKSHKMSHAHLSVTTPLPGTDLWDICKSKGIVSNDMDWRKLDFGNPCNDDLLYIDKEIPQKHFKHLLLLAQDACDKWNSPVTLRDYLLYVESLTFKELLKRTMNKFCYIINKFFRLSASIFKTAGKVK